MIGRLRKRFIRIAMLSVALVMLLLTLVVNIANYLSVNADLDSLLEMLSSDRGMQDLIPPDEELNFAYDRFMERLFEDEDGGSVPLDELIDDD